MEEHLLVSKLCDVVEFVEEHLLVSKLCVCGGWHFTRLLLLPTGFVAHLVAVATSNMSAY